MKQRRITLGLMSLLVGLAGACGTSLKLEPVTVAPIHLTVDVNVHDIAAAPTPAAAQKP